MTQADSVLSTPAINTSKADDVASTTNAPESPHQAIGRLRKETRDEINRLIGFLDKTDDYVSRELEDQVDDGPVDDNELDGPENGEDEDSDPAEPSLGSLDGKDDQTAWAADHRDDREVDPAESGIGDADGLLEQVGCGGWQGDRTGMV